MRVVIEPEMESHAPNLYSSQSTAAGIQGLDAFDSAAEAHYEREGFLLIRNAFSPEEVAAAKTELQAMTLSDNPVCESVYYEGVIHELIRTAQSQAGSNQVSDTYALGETRSELPPLPADQRARYVRKFMGFVDQHAPLGRIAYHPALLSIIDRLLGEENTLFQDMAMIKPPRGREKPWHQDHAYFNLAIETRIVAAWIALDEVTEKNGCMYLLAGQHHTGPRPHFLRRDWQLCDADILGQEQVAVPMSAGDVLLFDAKLPHGTPTNFSDQHRWALQLHYRPKSAQTITEEGRAAIFGGEGLGISC